MLNKKEAGFNSIPQEIIVLEDQGLEKEVLKLRKELQNAHKDKESAEKTWIQEVANIRADSERQLERAEGERGRAEAEIVKLKSTNLLL